MTLELSIEDYLIARIKTLGGTAKKVTYKGCRGAPDRLVILPGGRIVFVELKRPKGGRLSEGQRVEIRLLSGLGAEVHVLRTREEVDDVFGLDEKIQV